MGPEAYHNGYRTQCSMSRDNDSSSCLYTRFSLFPNRKTAHKAIIIVMNEKAKRGVAVVGTEIVKN